LVLQASVLAADSTVPQRINGCLRGDFTINTPSTLSRAIAVLAVFAGATPGRRHMGP
jgi:hypothetical protein